MSSPDRFQHLSFHLWLPVVDLLCLARFQSEIVCFWSKMHFEVVNKHLNSPLINNDLLSYGLIKFSQILF